MATYATAVMIETPQVTGLANTLSAVVIDRTGAQMASLPAGTSGITEVTAPYGNYLVPFIADTAWLYPVFILSIIGGAQFVTALANPPPAIQNITDATFVSNTTAVTFAPGT